MNKEIKPRPYVIVTHDTPKDKVIGVLESYGGKVGEYLVSPNEVNHSESVFYIREGGDIIIDIGIMHLTYWWKWCEVFDETKVIDNYFQLDSVTLKPKSLEESIHKIIENDPYGVGADLLTTMTERAKQIKAEYVNNQNLNKTT